MYSSSTATNNSKLQTAPERSPLQDTILSRDLHPPVSETVIQRPLCHEHMIKVNKILIQGCNNDTVRKTFKGGCYVCVAESRCEAAHLSHTLRVQFAYLTGTNGPHKAFRCSCLPWNYWGPVWRASSRLCTEHADLKSLRRKCFIWKHGMRVCLDVTFGLSCQTCSVPVGDGFPVRAEPEFSSERQLDWVKSLDKNSFVSLWNCSKKRYRSETTVSWHFEKWHFLQPGFRCFSLYFIFPAWSSHITRVKKL